MKVQDIRKKAPIDLKKLQVELIEELREFRFGMAGSAKKNIRRARAIRKDIARINTILNEVKQ